MRRLTSLTLLGCTLSSAAQAGHLEELLVTASKETQSIAISNELNISPDSAALLKKAPGANVNGNGPLTGIQQYRGMYGSRVSVDVNGAAISSGGPNWMDPPLSYAPAALLDSMKVYRGIAPVSAAQESIGGAITAELWSGEFGEGIDFETSGRVRAGGQTVNDGWMTSGALVTANQHHRIKLSAMIEQADDADFDGGKILPSEYDRDRVDLGYGYTRGAHTIQLDVARNETGDTGTPALPMDIEYIDSDLANLRYGFEGETYNITGQVFYSEVDHGMTNFHLRTPGMMQRRNIAAGDSYGFKLMVDWDDDKGQWRVGVDGHSSEHNSDISDPTNAMFFVTNFNDAERDVFGLFAERSQQISSHWFGEFGVRYNRVEMDSGVVDCNMCGMPGMMQMLRDNFNNADRKKEDDNFDAVAKFFYQVDQDATYYIGLARKTRTASYQERYLWMPMQATAGLADGNNYLGNLDLDPEVAHEIELGVDYDNGPLSVSPRVFYKDVDDYIQGTPQGIVGAADLKFNNVDAEFYGFDVEASYQLNQNWSVSGLVNYVRGERKDISDDLYRIAPLNGLISVEYRTDRWSAVVETVLVDEQDKVSLTNNETTSSGYGLVNLKGQWQVSEPVSLEFGLDNAFDKDYRDHLGGVNRVTNPNIAIGERLPGYGRNLFARIDYQF